MPHTKNYETKKLVIHIPAEMMDEIDGRATEEHRNRTQQCVFLFEHALKSLPRQKAAAKA